MSTLWLALTPLLVTWLPAGYFTSRIWNAVGLGCSHFSDESSRSCPRNHGKDWDWNRPFKSDDGPTYFGLGVMLGWITIASFIYLVSAMVILALVTKFFHVLGHCLMPQKSR